MVWSLVVWSPGRVYFIMDPHSVKEAAPGTKWFMSNKMIMEKLPGADALVCPVMPERT